jgi:transposase
MQVVFSFIDPVLGERLLMPTETAAQKEIDDEKNVFARLSAGVDEDVREGQSHEMRLQVLQQILESSPSAQQRYQQDEEFKSRVDKRMQQLQFQLQQKQNAVIGRLGA